MWIRASLWIKSEKRGVMHRNKRVIHTITQPEPFDFQVGYYKDGKIVKMIG
jgi:hypothetical protein